MSLDTVLSNVVKSVPEAVAAGFIDMNTGMLLGVKTVDSHPQEVLDLLAAATGDLFQGSNVVTIEKLFKRLRGLPADNDEKYFQEMIVLSSNLIHVFLRGKKYPDQVMVVVTRNGANLGMVLTKTRQSLAGVEEAA
jgi:hypothetical protein